MHWVGLFTVLLAFWAALSGDFHHWFHIAAGLVTSAVVTTITIRKSELAMDWSPLQGLRSLLFYLPWLLVQIVKANLRVLRIVWTPRLPINPCLFEVPVSLETANGRAVYANSITLTPGTVTVDTLDDRFVIHGLTRADRDELSDGSMEARVRALEPK